MHKLRAHTHKEIIAENQKQRSNLKFAKNDKLSNNLISLSMILLGGLNLLLYLAPLVVFKDWQTVNESGYDVMSWFGASFEEGRTLAICAFIIFLMSLGVTIYGIYMRIYKHKVHMMKHVHMLKYASFIYLIIIFANMFIIFMTIDSLRMRLMGEMVALPYAGSGLQILLLINIVIPILISIFSYVVKERILQNT